MRKQQNTKQKIKAINKLFENIRDIFSRDKINEIRTNLYKKELIYYFLKKKPNIKGSERRAFNNIVNDFDGLYSDLSKENKYRENFLYGLEQLFNEDLYYKPIEVKSAFNENYVLYESIGDEYRSLSVLQYLLDIKPYLYDLIEEYSYNDSWKIQLNMRVSFASLTDSTVRQTLYSKSDNVEIIHAVDTNGVINELFDTFLKRYQEGLETKMIGSSYFFEKVDLLQYHFHKVTLKRGSSYIASPDWVNNKKSTINPHNINDNNCFLYSIVAALNYQSIPSNPERISNLKPFISGYNWDDIEFPAGHKDYSDIKTIIYYCIKYIIHTS